MTHDPRVSAAGDDLGRAFRSRHRGGHRQSLAIASGTRTADEVEESAVRTTATTVRIESKFRINHRSVLDRK